MFRADVSVILLQSGICRIIVTVEKRPTYLLRMTKGTLVISCLISERFVPVR